MLARRRSLAGSTHTFMLSSPATRASRRWQLECGLVPPLLFHALLEALQRCAPPVPRLFAPCEADSAVAELALRTGGHALSQDSDFFILCARGVGTSYVPIDSIQYVIAPPKKDAAPEETPEDNDGFEQVGKRKRGARRAAPAEADETLSSHPPSDLSTLLAVRLRSYSAHALAGKLQLPPTLLPLFAAIAGNDYTGELQERILLHHAPGQERIPEAAELLRSAWASSLSGSKSGKVTPQRRGLARGVSDSAGSALSDDGTATAATSAAATPRPSAFGGAPPTPVDPVRALVLAVVQKALLRAEAARAGVYVTTAERDTLVDGIIDSAATYSVLTHSSAPHLASPSAPFFASSLPDGAHAEALELYRAAYARGQLRESLVEALTSRVFLSRIFLEDPESKSTQTVAAREVRTWLWAVLFDVWGMQWARDTLEEPMLEEEEESEDDEPQPYNLSRAYREGERPDDVISVNTESSESGDDEDDEKEEELDMDDLPARPGSAMGSIGAASREVKPPPVVTEWVRKGERFVGDAIPIASLVTLLSEAEDTLPPSLSELLGQHRASAGVASDEASAEAPAADPKPPPFVLQSADVRRDLFLFALGAHTPRVLALPVPLQPLAAVLRHVVRSDAARLGERTAKYAWTKAELKAAVHAGCVALRAHSQQSDDAAAAAFERPTGAADAQPTVRHIHASTTVQLLLETSHLLAQALLLEHVPPHALHDGPSFHAHLQGHYGPDEAHEERLLHAVLEGNDAVLAIDVELARREKKAQKKKDASLANSVPGAPVRAKPPPPKNAFEALLGDSET
jgi:hypothetical protein